MKQRTERLTLEKIVGGGQTLGMLEDGKKCFVWGGLPGETVEVAITKSKSNYCEGVVNSIIDPSSERINPKDTTSYLSTSPWQSMSFEAEQHYKAALIEEAFELHDIVLPDMIDVATDATQYGYRNKIEFSWYGHEVDGHEQLDLAFFRRGSKGKIPVDGTSLAMEEINVLACALRDVLRSKNITARQLKTVLIRSNRQGDCVWQLYVKDVDFALLSDQDAASLPAIGGEIIYSDPRSPASRITKRLASYGVITLTDTILDVPFRYATEGFFQINLPVYEQVLHDMQTWVGDAQKTLDLYSGVGSIGLTIGGDSTTLVEINEDAVREMRENIAVLGSHATAILAPSEKVTEYITADTLVIVDPPRAGLHCDIIEKLLDAKPARIIYLSCNPVTQARDVALLSEVYGIRSHRGYNFFPRTPHIEHLVVLDARIV